MIFDGLILISAFVLAASVTFATNWLALIPWRNNKDKHWSEQARLLYPVLTAARSNLLVVPGILTLVLFLMWPSSSPLWFFAGIASMLGANLGTLFLDHEVFVRISLQDLLRESAIAFLMRFLIWLVFISAAVAMPDEFNKTACGIAGLVILLWITWTRGGWIWLGRKTGLFQPAPERLRRIVDTTSIRMNVFHRDVLLMQSSSSQAFALPGDGILLFTKRLLDLFPDDEIAAICAHELAHLTESRASRYSRSIRILSYLPWIFFTPLIHTFGLGALFGLIAITALVPRVYSKISRVLESRADTMAKSNEGNEGIYARALARLYEDNLMPAVTTKLRSHPHLYDRLLAAGITPDFPRPKPAASITWHGTLFAFLGGALLAFFAIHWIRVYNGAD
jgi:Zn-dependent protease with chaperone function